MTVSDRRGRTSSRRRRFAALAIAAALAPATAGCRARPVSLSDLDGALRELHVRTVIARDGITLYAPFEPADAERLAAVAAEEHERVARALDAKGRAPVPVLLVPAPRGADPTLVDQVLPGDAGVRGFASRDAAVAVYVAAESDAATAPPPFVDRGVLRHELTHAVARQEGLDLEPWLNEATATYVAALLPREDGTLRPDPLPEFVLLARAAARETRLEDVLEWTSDGVASEETVVSRYALAASFLAFHVEDHPEDPLREVVRRLAGSPRSASLDSEASWRAWLAGFPLAERLERRFEDEDEAVRASTSWRLLEVAERFGDEPLGGAFDARAVDRLLDDPKDVPAGRYLLMHRASRLAEGEIERLEATDRPLHRVLALALRKLRGETVPAPLARSHLDALPPDEAPYAYLARHVLLQSSSADH